MGRVVAKLVLLIVAYLVAAALILPHVRLPGGAEVAALPIGLIAIGLGVLFYVNLPGRLQVGADGVLIDWRGEQRYIGFCDVSEISVYTESSGGKTFIGVAFALDSGENVKVPRGENQFGADAQAAALSRDASEAFRAYQAREMHDNASALERGDRTPEAWLTRLRGLAAGANAGPREAVVTEDRLWRIVEDPSARAGVRAGAAAALAATSDGGARERLRIAASDTAEPRLRVALESAASGDDEALLSALADVEPEKDAKRART